MNPRGYVCAFRGRRDDYQVPLALGEVGKLVAFITDAYASAPIWRLAGLLPHRVAEKIRSRHHAHIADDRVHCLWATTAKEYLRNVCGLSRYETYDLLDREYSLAAAARARAEKANLFLYSPYAWEAFSASYTHNPKKIIFQYHPHVETEFEALEGDARRFSEVFSGGMNIGSPASIKSAARTRSDESWTLADHIVCASTFTRRSLLAEGAEEARISVVPYGVDLPVPSHNTRRDTFFHVLFVGSGVQRKGLHHLLLAWQRAHLPSGSKLTLICRVIEPAFLRLIQATPRVELIRGVDRAQLELLYSSATLFAMPSMIEGFGQVYLEALSFGLPVLGTKRTGLPDLGTEADGIYTCDAGNIDELVEILCTLSRTLPGRDSVNESARRCAGRFSWERFRGHIQMLL